MIQRAAKIIREEGISVFAKKVPPYLYQQVWPYLPRAGHTCKNGIKSYEQGRLPDKYLPGYLTQYVARQPEYEDQYIEAIRKYVTEGQATVLVGGGEGISTVAAANQVQESGKVTVFEGGAEEARKTRKTVEVNGVGDRTSVHHAIVSEDISLRSSSGGAEILPPADLPECDVLAIDADGAEVPILSDISIKPETLIIEHHAVAAEDGVIVEYQPDYIRRLISDLGYDVVEELSDPNGAGGGRFEERIYIAANGN